VNLRRRLRRRRRARGKAGRGGTTGREGRAQQGELDVEAGRQRKAEEEDLCEG